MSAPVVQSEFDGDDVDNDDDDDDTGEYDDDPGGGDDDGGDAEDDDGDGTATVFVVCCCVLLHGANRGKDGDVAEGKATMALIHSPMNSTPGRNVEAPRWLFYRVFQNVCRWRWRCWQPLSKWWRLWCWQWQSAKRSGANARCWRGSYGHYRWRRMLVCGGDVHKHPFVAKPQFVATP